MTTKKEAIEYAKKFNWTAADAKRAFANLNLEEASEQDILMALVTFAGSELLERQRLQAAQKGQVTKKNNYIKQVEQDFATKIDQYEETLKKERSLFVSTIAKVYQFAQRFGLSDPWIETLLSQYNKYQDAA
ncbi:hypothetical protein [Mastigocoleus testarum]|uniref:Uncharacterized protein n=1 Tax=Mastigocoleus testarum BC008 TaxID=371196 RepID=A0A0V7ZYV1_9CYAN|nr:hypothetical protein [Mastigocoleus testarum]KST67615.1 hypothetical protein BC008_30950 [Mastigocoleus testarum BC008]KST69749.1 hypothetical protein BC008_35900 [Mastigocoleus testarum BC008]